MNGNGNNKQRKRSKRYVKCLVPHCKSSKRETPDLIFLTVPSNPKTRQAWLDAVGRKDVAGHKNYCCEKHFILEEDAYNWIYYKLMGSRLILKPNVVPHRFLKKDEDQSSFKQHLSKNHRKLKEENLKSWNNHKIEIKSNNNNLHSATTTHTEPIITSPPALVNSMLQIVPSTNNSAVNLLYMPILLPQITPIPVVPQDLLVITPPVIQPAPLYTIINPSQNINIPPQVNIQLNNNNGTVTKNSIKPNELVETIPRCEYQISLLKLRPQFYLGIPQDLYYIVKLCSLLSCTSERDILISLRKIKIGDGFLQLANLFGLKCDAVRLIFRRTVESLQHVFTQLIYWPEKEQILKNLPQVFIPEYTNIQALMDCFEIKFNTNKKIINHTVKYLIATTPNGFCTFVSKRIRRSKQQFIYDSIPNDAIILADKGFMHLARENNALGCGNKGNSNNKVEGRIEALSVHIEKFFCRLRHFQIMRTNFSCDPDVFKVMDHVVVIVCGLINIRQGMMKKQ